MNNEHTETPAADSSPEAAAGTSPSIESRRRFIRASAVGGAVLLTLHNHAAWGKTTTYCISENLWLSYQANAPSATNNSPENQKAIDKYFNASGQLQGKEKLEKGEYCKKMKT